MARITKTTKTAKTAKKSPANSKRVRRGGENVADAKRRGGPRYHGHGWTDTEPSRGKAKHSELTDPGTRGAVFGRGGTGIVERQPPRAKRKAR